MLTVIIAEEKIIEQFKTLNTVLSPFQKNEVIFCRWNTKGETIDEILPELKTLIPHKTQWKAVVITGDNKGFINPFDYVNNLKAEDQSSGFETPLMRKCEARFNDYDRATLNPLVKLSSALCESPLYAETIEPEIYEDIMSNKLSLEEYMFSRKIHSMNTKKIAVDIRRNDLKRLETFVPKDKADSFLRHLAEKNVPELINALTKDNLVKFLRYISTEEFATLDLGYWAVVLENTKLSMLHKELNEKYSLGIMRPQEVLYLAVRNYDTRLHKNKMVWIDKNEMDYSDFVKANLYNERIRFMVYDAQSEEKYNLLSEQLKFHTLLQIVAMFGNSAHALNKNRLYSVNVEYDHHEFSEIVAKYIAKLNATATAIKEEIYTLKSQELPPLDNKSARQLFESAVDIPVKVDREYDKENFKVFQKVGLFRDRPGEEGQRWDAQVHTINLLFKRFLREPVRAIKKACRIDLRNKSVIYDERVIGLNEAQRDDIRIKAEEEEQAMVEALTKSGYDVENFKERINDADKNVKDYIKQRMAKKKALNVIGIALIAFVCGFIPLLWSNSNNWETFLYSALLLVCSVLIYSVCGWIYLIVSKKGLKKKIEEFNQVLESIYSEVKSSLDDYSRYLAHTCMVMRENSVLQLSENCETERDRAIKILNYNLFAVESVKANAWEFGSDFSGVRNEDYKEYTGEAPILPFDYDFTQQKMYTYPLYDVKQETDIDYMVNGYKVKIPISYIKKVTVEREELYE